MTASRLRPRLLAVLALLLAAVAGVAIGVALDRAMWRSRALGYLAGGAAHRHGSSRHARGYLLDRLDGELGLSDSQRVRVDSVLARRETDMRALRDQVRPRFDSIASRTRGEILELLTPEQREKFQALGRSGGGG